MTNKKISEFTLVTSIQASDYIPLVRNSNGTLLNLIIKKENLLTDDATTSSKGIVQLAGDLGGTAIAPTVPSLANKANINSPNFTGNPTTPNLAITNNSTSLTNSKFVHDNVDPLKVDSINVLLNGSVLNKTYNILLKAPYNYSILELNSLTSSSTCFLTINKNSVAFGNATNISINTTLSTTSFSSTLDFVIGDTLSITITQSNTAQDLAIGLKVLRV